MTYLAGILIASALLWAGSDIAQALDRMTAEMVRSRKEKQYGPDGPVGRQ